MNKKKILSLVLALAIAATLCVPAFAAVQATGTNSFAMGLPDNQASTKEANANTTLTGTIKATNLKVTVTTSVQFEIDPTLTADAAVTKEIKDNGFVQGTFGQVTQPEIKITNESLVPIYAEVTKVEVSKTKDPDTQIETDDVVLVNVPANLYAQDASLNSNVNYKEHSMMFALGKIDESKDFDATADWLLKGSVDSAGAGTHYWLSEDNGYIAPATGNGSQTTAGQMHLRIFGQVQMGWHAEDTFTLTPTIVVTCVKPA